MDLHQRKKDLLAHIKQDLELQKKLEDQRRYEDDEKKKQKLNNQIQEVIRSINTYQVELDSIGSSKQEQESLLSAMTAITFKELSLVTQGILCMPIPSDINFQVLPPVEKMLKNQLTGVAQSRLMTGVIQAKMVSSFVENMVNVIPDFPERLKAGFVREYQRLRETGLEGNTLFDALHKFTCDRSEDYDLQAAGLAVLYYLFEKCEVFER